MVTQGGKNHVSIKTDIKWVVSFIYEL